MVKSLHNMIFIKSYFSMANTFTQLHYHIVFATKYRNGLILPSWREELHKHITGIVQNNGHKMLQVNSMPDHIHLLIGMRPDQSLSSLMRMVKSDSSKWIKDQGYCANFAWQEGYAAFCNSKSQLSRVMLYIQNQQEHHCKQTFHQEFIVMLKKAEIEFDEKYIFQAPV